LLRAAEAFSLDLGRSVMIGDALSDVQAGRAAGVGQSILVLTGRGAEQAELPEADGLRPMAIYASLAGALVGALTPNNKTTS
jgi:D-glycero-D-manno-heptose 1,7-bisphosphate phosphatase